MQTVATTLIADLKDCLPLRVEGVPEELHELSPFLPKERWTLLGDTLKIAEKPTMVSIPGNNWISFRCDGTGFSKFLKGLRRKGVIEAAGFSEQFSSIMQECCQALVVKYI